MYGPETTIVPDVAGGPDRSKLDARTGCVKLYWSTLQTQESIPRPGLGDIPATRYTILAHEENPNWLYIVALSRFLWGKGTQSTLSERDTYAYSVYIIKDGVVDDAPLDNLMLIISGTKYNSFTFEQPILEHSCVVPGTYMDNFYSAITSSKGFVQLQNKLTNKFTKRGELKVMNPSRLPSNSNLITGVTSMTVKKVPNRNLFSGTLLENAFPLVDGVRVKPLFVIWSLSQVFEDDFQTQYVSDPVTDIGATQLLYDAQYDEESMSSQLTIENRVPLKMGTNYLLAGDLYYENQVFQIMGPAPSGTASAPLGGLSWDYSVGPIQFPLLTQVGSGDELQLTGVVDPDEVEDELYPQGVVMACTSGGKMYYKKVVDYTVAGPDRDAAYPNGDNMMALNTPLPFGGAAGKVNVNKRITRDGWYEKSAISNANAVNFVVGSPVTIDFKSSKFQIVVVNGTSQYHVSAPRYFTICEYLVAIPQYTGSMTPHNGWEVNYAMQARIDMDVPSNFAPSVAPHFMGYVVSENGQIIVPVIISENKASQTIPFNDTNEHTVSASIGVYPFVYLPVDSPSDPHKIELPISTSTVIYGAPSPSIKVNVYTNQVVPTIPVQSNVLFTTPAILGDADPVGDVLVNNVPKSDRYNKTSVTYEAAVFSDAACLNKVASGGEITYVPSFDTVSTIIASNRIDIIGGYNVGGTVGQSFTVNKSCALTHINVAVDGPSPQLRLRKWVSDTYNQAFTGDIIALSNVLPPAQWSDMSTFVFPTKPTLSENTKYVFEGVGAGLLVYLNEYGAPGYTGGMAHSEPGQAQGDTNFEVRADVPGTPLPINVPFSSALTDLNAGDLTTWSALPLTTWGAYSIIYKPGTPTIENFRSVRTVEQCNSSFDNVKQSGVIAPFWQNSPADRDNARYVATIFQTLTDTTLFSNGIQFSGKIKSRTLLSSYTVEAYIQTTGTTGTSQSIRVTGSTFTARLDNIPAGTTNVEVGFRFDGINLFAQNGVDGKLLGNLALENIQIGKPVIKGTSPWVGYVNAYSPTNTTLLSKSVIPEQVNSSFDAVNHTAVIAPDWNSSTAGRDGARYVTELYRNFTNPSEFSNGIQISGIVESRTLLNSYNVKAFIRTWKSANEDYNNQMYTDVVNGCSFFARRNSFPVGTTRVSVGFKIEGINLFSQNGVDGTALGNVVIKNILVEKTIFEDNKDYYLQTSVNVTEKSYVNRVVPVKSVAFKQRYYTRPGLTSLVNTENTTPVDALFSKRTLTNILLDLTKVKWYNNYFNWQTFSDTESEDPNGSLQFALENYNTLTVPLTPNAPTALQPYTPIPALTEVKAYNYLLNYKSASYPNNHQLKQSIQIMNEPPNFPNIKFYTVSLTEAAKLLVDALPSSIATKTYYANVYQDGVLVGTHNFLTNVFTPVGAGLVNAVSYTVKLYIVENGVSSGEGDGVVVKYHDRPTLSLSGDFMYSSMASQVDPVNTTNRLEAVLNLANCVDMKEASGIVTVVANGTSFVVPSSLMMTGDVDLSSATTTMTTQNYILVQVNSYSNGGHDLSIVSTYSGYDTADLRNMTYLKLGNVWDGPVTFIRKNGNINELRITTPTPLNFSGTNFTWNTPYTYAYTFVKFFPVTLQRPSFVTLPGMSTGMNLQVSVVTDIYPNNPPVSKTNIPLYLVDATVQVLPIDQNKNPKARDLFNELCTLYRYQVSISDVPNSTGLTYTLNEGVHFPISTPLESETFFTEWLTPMVSNAPTQTLSVYSTYLGTTLKQLIYQQSGLQVAFEPFIDYNSGTKTGKIFGVGSPITSIALIDRLGNTYTMSNTSVFTSVNANTYNYTFNNIPNSDFSGWMMMARNPVGVTDSLNGKFFHALDQLDNFTGDSYTYITGVDFAVIGGHKMLSLKTSDSPTAFTGIRVKENSTWKELPSNEFITSLLSENQLSTQLKLHVDKHRVTSTTFPSWIGAMILNLMSATPYTSYQQFIVNKNVTPSPLLSIDIIQLDKCKYQMGGFNPVPVVVDLVPSVTTELYNKHLKYTATNVADTRVMNMNEGFFF